MLHLYYGYIVRHGPAVGHDLDGVGFFQVPLARMGENHDPFPVEAEMDDAVGGALMGVEFAAFGRAVGFDKAGIAPVLVKCRQLSAKHDGLGNAAVLAQGADQGGAGMDIFAHFVFVSRRDHGNDRPHLLAKRRSRNRPSRGGEL